LENVRVRSFPEIGNVGALEFPEIGKHQKVQSFQKLNKQMNNIPWKLTRVLGYIRIVEQILTAGNIGKG